MGGAKGAEVVKVKGASAADSLRFRVDSSYQNQSEYIGH